MRLPEFSTRVLRRLAHLDPIRAVATMPAPRAPIGHGAAGVALFLAEVARHSKGAARRRAADRALAWVTAAERSLRQPRSAYAFPETSPSRSLGHNVFYGRAGVHTVAARVAFVRRDAPGLRRAAARFLDAWTRARGQRGLPTEVFLGSAGFIHAARDFEAHAADLAPDLAPRLRAVGDEAHARVTASLARLVARPLPKRTIVGYAHGLVGELDAALAWDRRPSSIVAAVLDRLLAQAVVDGRLISWPAEVGGDPCGPWWASWCNGVAGHVYLWCRAYEVFRDRRYLTAARLAAQTTVTLRPGHPTVCCGTAGQALALHRFFRLTADPAYRRSAVVHARRACREAAATRESNLAYFGGLSGIAHVAFAVHERRGPYLPLVEEVPCGSLKSQVSRLET